MTGAAAAASSFTSLPAHRHGESMSELCVLLLVPLLSHLASAIQFHLPVNSVKCLKEEVDRDVLVTGEYELSEEPRTTTNLKVRERVAPVTYGEPSPSGTGNSLCIFTP